MKIRGRAHMMSNFFGHFWHTHQPSSDFVLFLRTYLIYDVPFPKSDPPCLTHKELHDTNLPIATWGFRWTQKFCKSYHFNRFKVSRCKRKKSCKIWMQKIMEKLPKLNSRSIQRQCKVSKSGLQDFAETLIWPVHDFQVWTALTDNDWLRDFLAGKILSS